MTNSTIVLAPRCRPGGQREVGTQREVVFLDIVVGGQSMYDLLRSRGYDLVSCLGWLGPESDRDSRARLLVVAPGDMPSGRVALYICPEDADLGCGAITANVTVVGDHFVWSDIGYEINYETGWTPEPGLGPFSFDATEYRRVLEQQPGITRGNLGA